MAAPVDQQPATISGSQGPLSQHPQTSYEQNPTNDPTLGFEFERAVAIYSLLTLRPNHALGCEVKIDPVKFDDVVLRVGNGNDSEYYCRQLKHRDTESNNRSDILTWENLLFRANTKDNSEKKAFSIRWYYEKYQSSKLYSDNNATVKEWSFVTNYKLVGEPGTATSRSNLKLIAQDLYKRRKTNEMTDITEADMEHYFENWSNVSEWTSPTTDQKSYKLSQNAITDILNGILGPLTASNQSERSDYEKFLKLLVFHTSMPHVDELKKINQRIMKLFFPFYSDCLSLKTHNDDLVSGMLQLFKEIKAGEADWATRSHRSRLFDKTVTLFKKEVSLGSAIGYEAKDVMDQQEKITGFEWFATGRHWPWCEQLKHETLNDSIDYQSWQSRSPKRVLNVFTRNTNGPQIATMKLLNECLEGTSSSLAKLLIVRIDGANALAELIKHFMQLNTDVGNYDYVPRNDFCIAIEVQSTPNADTELSAAIGSMIESFSSMSNLRKWIKFVVFTQHEIQIPGDAGNYYDFESVEDATLEWKDLSDAAKKYLYEKTLILVGDRKTVLKAIRNQGDEENIPRVAEDWWETNMTALGITEATLGGWMAKDPESLVQLIIHDNKRPLSLSLPTYNAELDMYYVHRHLKLPLVTTENMSQDLKERLTFKTKDYIAKFLKGNENIFYFLKPVSSRHDSAYLWERATNGQFHNLRTLRSDWYKRRKKKSRNILQHLRRGSLFRRLVMENERSLAKRSVNKGMPKLNNALVRYKKKQVKLAHKLSLLLPVASTKGTIYRSKTNKVLEKCFRELKDHVIRSKDSDYLLDESRLLDGDISFGTGSDKNKLSVVVDLPGKGKTYLLTSLTNQFLKRAIHKEKLEGIILRINLSEIEVSIWDNATGIDGSKISAVNFLVDNLLMPMEEAGRLISASGNALSPALVKQMCLNQHSLVARVHLLLDGLDEINERHHLKVFKLIDQLLLAKGIKRIILASRPDNGLEKTLEEHFKTFPIHLKNFDEQDQINYLRKRWKSLAINDEENNAVVQEYSKELVKYSQIALKDKDDRFLLDIPLQCLIISECFTRGLIAQLQKYRDNPSTVILPDEFKDENFELLHLYDLFYDKKIDILFEDKTNLKFERSYASSFLKTELKQSFLENIERLSVFYMMDLKEAELLCRLSWKTYRNSKFGQDLKRAMKLGLVRSGLASNQSNLDGPRFKFLHRTFPEYFFANFLLKHFTQSTSELLDDIHVPVKMLNPLEVSEAINGWSLLELITEQILVNTNLAGTRRFFDRMLAKYIPQPGEQCPFALGSNRSQQLLKWPVISHENFNSLVAETVLRSDYFKFFKMWPSEETGELSSNEQLELDLSYVNQSKSKSQHGVIGMLRGFTIELKNLTLLLIYCAREYATRPEVSNEIRKALAHSLTIAAFMWIDGEDRNCENRSRIITVLLQCFDPAEGLSDDQNHIFSTWFFKIVNKLVDREPKWLSHLEALSLACPMMWHHRYASCFQDEAKRIAAVIFGDEEHGNSCVAMNEYLTPSTRWRDPSNNAQDSEEKRRHFSRILSTKL